MNSYLVLLLCASTLPTIICIAVTRPLWRLQRFRNDDIHLIGITIVIISILSMLISTIVLAVTTSNWNIILLCAPASMINMVFFDQYDLLLYTRRCPHCRRNTLRVHSVANGTYQLHCRSCNISTIWRK